MKTRLMPGMLAAAVALLMGMTTAAATSPQRMPAQVRITPSNAKGHTLPGPGYYRITARPGSMVELYADIANVGGRAGTAQIVPVDAKSGVYGGVSYDLPNQRRSDVGAWLAPEMSSVTLAPKQSVIVPVFMRVPLHVNRGVHVGGLTAYIPASQKKGTGFGSIQIQLRVVAAVVVTIPGRMRTSARVLAMRIERRPTGLYLLTHVMNTGNTLMKGWLKDTVTAPSGRRLMHRTVFVDTLVPRTAINYPMPWPGVRRAGVCRATAKLTGMGRSRLWRGHFRCGAAAVAPPLRRATALRLNPGSSSGVKSLSTTTELIIGGLGTALLILAGTLLAVLFRQRMPRLSM